MRNIALISLHTPTINNVRGASALPYHLIAFRPSEVSVEVWSFNINGCDDEQIRKTEIKLGIKINIIPIPKSMSYFKYPLIRLFLNKPILGYLKLHEKEKTEISDFLRGKDSALWIYGEDIASIANLFKHKSIVITTPDCEAMYYYRVLEKQGIPLSKISLIRYSLMYHRYARIASQYPVGSNIRYHLVGMADTKFLKKLNPNVDARFIPHPHYEVHPCTIEKSSAQEIIKLLIAGRYDFYMSDSVDEAIRVLRRLPERVKARYNITFLGKDWEHSNEELLNAGYKSEIKGFVEDYAAELCSHDIQLTPITVGTGTKGKVLDAFVNGLMVIGTPLALENIAVESGVDCVEYSTPEELYEWLVMLSGNPTLISKIAAAGKDAVLYYHSREKIANEFFGLFD